MVFPQLCVGLFFWAFSAVSSLHSGSHCFATDAKAGIESTPKESLREGSCRSFLPEACQLQHDSIWLHGIKTHFTRCRRPLENNTHSADNSPQHPATPDNSKLSLTQTLRYTLLVSHAQKKNMLISCALQMSKKKNRRETSCLQLYFVWALL